MISAKQNGFTLPEALAALILAGMAIALAGSFAGMRVDAAKAHGQRHEERYVASLVERAHRQGRLAEDASTAAELRAALPHVAVPVRLGDGRAYRIALDGADPRIQISANGDPARPVRVVRPPAPISELRVPFWRARQLRQSRPTTSE